MQEHILRRMGFGASPDDLAFFADFTPAQLIDELLNYAEAPAGVDALIGHPAHASVTVRGTFSPDTVINDARQRWLFRMIHTRQPLQEKMALFWHQHFATAYSKVAGTFGSIHATKMMDAVRQPNGTRGQIQLFRDMATGNFRDLLIEVAKDPAMLVWLDGRTNTRTRPQENFARELMELFTTGIGHYTEADVQAAARVFTGWNLELVVVNNRTDEVNSYYRSIYNPAQHDTDAKTFTFAIYPDGGRTIPARSSAQGGQDGVDLIEALARHPATADRLARRLYAFFINDVDAPDEGLIRQVAEAYRTSGTYSIHAMLRRLLHSPQFLSSTHVYQRYSWPVEYVVRAVKETGWRGFSVDAAITPLVNMGQSLYEPPDVNGWATGPRWFSTSSMLARLNFASTLATNQRANLVRDAQPFRSSPERVLEHLLSRHQTPGFSSDGYSALHDYLRSGIRWTGTDAQLNAKVPGAVRLLLGSAEYQFV